MSLFSRITRIIKANFDEMMERRDQSDRYREKVYDEEPPSSGSGSSYDKGPEYSGGDSLLAKYYANLEIPYGSDLETATAAWKRLMKKYHPDRHSSDPQKQKVANELVQELNRAYDYIKNYLEKQ